MAPLFFLEYFFYFCIQKLLKTRILIYWHYFFHQFFTSFLKQCRNFNVLLRCHEHIHKNSNMPYWNFQWHFKVGKKVVKLYVDQKIVFNGLLIVLLLKFLLWFKSRIFSSFWHCFKNCLIINYWIEKLVWFSNILLFFIFTNKIKQMNKNLMNFYV